MLTIRFFYSLRTATVIAGVLGRAGQRGQERRLKDAELGEVTWRNPVEIQKFLEIQEMIKQAEDDAARAARKEEGKEGRSADNIPGMMNEDQLAAFQLLQSLERERRSGGRRRRGEEDEM